MHQDAYRIALSDGSSLNSWTLEYSFFNSMFLGFFCLYLKVDGREAKRKQKERNDMQQRFVAGVKPGML